MHIWQLQEAKAKLTELVKEARYEPQIISRHGVNEVVVISIQEYKRAFEKEESLISFFKRSPLYGVELDLTRDESPMRDIDFDEHDEK
jgi:antitoxin Phd